MADNLRISCANHFRSLSKTFSSDSRKFCSCFSSDFVAAYSLRDFDPADGVLTPEIQQQFERSADLCGRDISAVVARSGKAWALDTD